MCCAAAAVWSSSSGKLTTCACQQPQQQPHVRPHGFQPCHAVQQAGCNCVRHHSHWQVSVEVGHRHGAGACRQCVCRPCSAQGQHHFLLNFSWYRGSGPATVGLSQHCTTASARPQLAAGCMVSGAGSHHAGKQLPSCFCKLLKLLPSSAWTHCCLYMSDPVNLSCLIEHLPSPVLPSLSMLRASACRCASLQHPLQTRTACSAWHMTCCPARLT